MDAVKRFPLRRRKPISRSRMKRKGPNPNKLRAGRVPQNPAYIAWVKEQPCVGLTDWPSNSEDGYGVQGHYCFGPTDPSHERNHTGFGLKAPDETCVPMCRALHNQWEDHTGRYAGWSNEKRHEYMANHRRWLNERYEVTTGVKLA